MHCWRVREQILDIIEETTGGRVIFGSVGPMMRASGIAQDMRKLGYGAYSQLEFEPITRTNEDSYDRCCKAAILPMYLF